MYYKYKLLCITNTNFFVIPTQAFIHTNFSKNTKIPFRLKFAKPLRNQLSFANLKKITLFTSPLSFLGPKGWKRENRIRIISLANSSFRNEEKI